MRFGIATIGVVIALGSCREALGQDAVSSPPRERVHPELVDSTWGRRTKAAWELAFARRWKDARTSFDALHREQPAAIEPASSRGAWSCAPPAISRSPAAPRGGPLRRASITTTRGSTAQRASTAG